MKHLLPTGILLGLLMCVHAPAYADPRDVTARENGRRMIEGAFVHQLVDFNFNQVTPRPDASWVVGEVVPGKDNGVVFVKSHYIDGSNGRVVNVPGGRDYAQYQGVFQIHAQLTGRPLPTRFSYQWRETPVGVVRGPRERNAQPLASLQVFDAGAIVIAQIDASKQGRDRFPLLYSLPPQWKALAAPAYRFYKSNTGLFNAQQTPQNELRLRALLDDSNPFTAIAACRRLAQAGKLDKTFIEGPLARVRGLRQAIFACLFVRQGALQSPTHELETGARFAPLTEELVRKQPVSGLKNLLLGTSIGDATELFDPFDRKTPTPGFGPALTRAIIRRTRALKLSKPRNQDERDLLSMLQNHGLR